MKHSRCAHTLLVALLSALLVLSQAQADGSTVPLDSDGDRISDVNVDFPTDASEYSDDGGLDGRTGDIAVTGELEFKICDSRTGETGSQIRISRAGSVTTRNVPCD